MKKVLKKSLSILLAITIILSSAYVGLNEIDFGKIKFDEINFKGINFSGVSEFIKVLTPDFFVKSQAASESGLTFALNDDGVSYYVSACSESASGELVIPSTYNGKPVTSIGDYAFFDRTSLTSIKIPNSVTSIGFKSFDNCTSLTSITIPDSVTSIGYGAFFDTGYYNDSSNWENGVLYIDNHLIKADSDILTDSYTIRNGVKTIADDAFSDCVNLTKIIIPDSVTSIGEYAFENCVSLTTITIPDNVTSIEIGAFKYCYNLASITIPDGVTSIGEDAFEYCYNLDSIIIPDSVKSIGYNAFSFCESLMSIEIPDSVTSVGSRAFFYCTDLVEVTIGDGLTILSIGLFDSCENLVSLKVGDGLKEIRDDVFWGCENLEEISIGSKVEYISAYAWYSQHIDNLSVYYAGTKEEWNDIGTGVSLSNVVVHYSVEYSKNHCKEDRTYAACTGEVTYTCPCGYYETVQETTNAPGHKFKETVLSAPSCTEYAEIEKRCEVCGLTETHISYEDTGHCYKKITSGKNAGRYKCTQCNAVVDDVFESQPNEICSLDPQDLVVLAANYYVYWGQPSAKSVRFVMYYMDHFLFPELKYAPAEAFEEKVAAHFDVSSEELRETQNRFVRYNPDDNTYETKGFHGYGGAGHFSALGYLKNGDKYHVYWTLHQEQRPDKIYETFKCTLKYDNNTPKFVKFETIEFEDVPDNLITGHKSSSWLIDKKATVYKAGSKHKECIECGEVLKTKTIAQLKCSKPVLEKVYNANSYVKVTWSTVKGADLYRVYRKTGTGDYEYIGSTTNTYFNDKEAGAGKTCRYRIKAKNEAGYSEYSASIAIKHIDEPTLKSIENSEYGVLIKWDKVTGAQKYSVYRKVSGGEYKYIGATSNTYYTDKTAKSGKKYYYAIRGKRDDSVSSQSVSLSKYYLEDPTLNTPSSTSKGVGLRWSKVTGAEGYMVYRKTANGSYKRITTEKGVDNLTFRDTTAKKGTKYYYKVKAYYSKTYSAYSNTKSITDKY